MFLTCRSEIPMFDEVLNKQYYHEKCGLQLVTFNIYIMQKKLYYISFIILDKKKKKKVLFILSYWYGVCDNTNWSSVNTLFVFPFHILSCGLWGDDPPLCSLLGRDLCFLPCYFIAVYPNMLQCRSSRLRASSIYRSNVYQRI